MTAAPPHPHREQLRAIYLQKMELWFRGTADDARFVDRSGQAYPLTAPQFARFRARAEAALDTLLDRMWAPSPLLNIALPAILFGGAFAFGWLARMGVVGLLIPAAPIFLLGRRSVLSMLDLPLDFAQLHGRIANEVRRAAGFPQSARTAAWYDFRAWRWAGWSIAFAIGASAVVLGRSEGGSRILALVVLSLIVATWTLAARYKLRVRHAVRANRGPREARP